MAEPETHYDEIDRRTLIAGAAGLSLIPGAALSAQPVSVSPIHVGMLVHPDMVLLDLVGPQTVMSLAMAQVHLIGKTRAPVSTDVGLAVAPTVAFEEAPKDFDVLFVPGGLKGSIDCMQDPEVLAFMADRGARARYVTSVCTGSLVLAAAGLLKGYQATSHWYVKDLLSLMGATAAPGRVVTDRNRVTAGGVTAGIDFGLTLASALRGKDFAERIQLTLEYTPDPPLRSGTPEEAGAAMTNDVLSRRAPLIAAARAAAEAVGRRI